ncbi:hypothetical protein L596_025430 [Steinernema carpocapsae]|uniref:Chaperone DnaJ C-terminal domain-containing protein n=1 Tax=Steinernema carpocapsae TaxID=34508 RepID=A0A4U5M7T9_STECR|nr:hypothetical protein L596_025430 [Steinernema carpocapsae]
MRLTGKGIKRLNHNGRGDQYISIKVRMPKHLNERQKALIQAWAELELDTPGTVTGIRKTEDGLQKAQDGDLIAKLRAMLDECVDEKKKVEAESKKGDSKAEKEAKKKETKEVKKKEAQAETAKEKLKEEPEKKQSAA